jgi:endogenous inhibitor of DNA gyrase (YacG/DUF329 family)
MNDTTEQCPKCGKFVAVDEHLTFYDWVNGALRAFCSEACYVLWIANDKGSSPES